LRRVTMACMLWPLLRLVRAQTLSLSFMMLLARGHFCPASKWSRGSRNLPHRSCPPLASSRDGASVLRGYYESVRPSASHWYSAPHGSTTWRSPFTSRQQVPTFHTRAWKADHRHRPNRIHLRCRPAIHLQLLSTPPRGDAVSVGYRPEGTGLAGTCTP
jgi:hypothetical protein